MTGFDSIGIVRPVEGGIGNSTPLQPAGIAARNVVHLACIQSARIDLAVLTGARS
jgi:hypothetical protein